MLPSSSGPGRQPPQAGNGGSNPSGSANLDPLVDRDCVLLDGRCKCEKPMRDCKYLSKTYVECGPNEHN